MTKPVPSPIETQSDDAAFRMAVIEGIGQADAGLGTPFEDVAEWLATWGADDEAAPPQ